MATAKIRRRRPRQPYGTMAALLVGCMVTLIGVFCGHDPFTVLIRSVVSAVGVGLMVSIGISIIRIANIPSESGVRQ